MREPCDRRDQWYHQRHHRRKRTVSRWQASAKPSPSVALDPVDGGSATSARRCSRGSLRFCHYARKLVSAARPKESSFLQRRTKLSEGRSERPDVTEASSSRPPALRTGGKGVWSHTTDSVSLQGLHVQCSNRLYGLGDHYGKQPWMQQETPMPAPQPSKSMTRTAT